MAVRLLGARSTTVRLKGERSVVVVGYGSVGEQVIWTVGEQSEKGESPKSFSKMRQNSHNPTTVLHYRYLPNHQLVAELGPDVQRNLLLIAK